MEISINKRIIKKRLCVIVSALILFGCIGPCIAFAGSVYDATLYDVNSESAITQTYDAGYFRVSENDVSYLESGTDIVFTPYYSGYYRIESLCFINAADPYIFWGADDFCDDVNGLDFCLDVYLTAGVSYYGTVYTFSEDEVVLRITPINVEPVYIVTGGNVKEDKVTGGNVTGGNITGGNVPGSYIWGDGYEVRIINSHDCELLNLRVSGGNVEIPDRISGYTVVGLSDDFRFISNCYDVWGDYCGADIISVTIPSTVLYLNPESFNRIETLESIYMEQGYASGTGYYSSDGILYNNNGSQMTVLPAAYCGTLYIPENVSTISGIQLNNCKNITGFEVSEYNSHYSVSEDGKYLYNYERTRLIRAVGIEGAPDGLSSDIKEIGEYAFSDNDRMTRIAIPENVSTIAYFCFGDCTSLQEVTLSDAGTEIGDWAFAGCTSLAAMDLKNTQLIGKCAFSQCESLNSIVIPASVDKMGECAFEQSGLTSVSFAGKPSQIQSGTFSGCNKLETVDLNENNVASSMFYGCTALRSVDLSRIESIGSSAFGNSGLTSLVLPDSVLFVGRGAFSDCRSLKSVKISRNAKFESYTFADDYALTSVEFADGFDGFGYNDFSYCCLLESVDIPDSVTKISYGTFADCFALMDINAPEDIYIEAHCFDGTAWLNAQNNGDVYFNDTMYTFKNYDGGYDEESYDISASGYIDTSALWNVVTSENVTDGNVTDGNVTDGNTHGYYGRNMERPYRLVVKSGTKYIAQYACDNEFNLKMLSLPDTLLAIYSGAFCSSGLTSVFIPDSVETIEWPAFAEHKWGDYYTGDIVIYCNEGSAAQAYAEEYGFNYETVKVQCSNYSTVDYNNKIVMTSLHGENNVNELLKTNDPNTMLIPVASKYSGATPCFGTGSLIYVFINGSLVDSYTVVVNGDLDGDSASDVLDIVLAERIANNYETASDAQMYAAGTSPELGFDISSYQYLVNTALA